MATYKTPDVYIKEISIFPPSVAEVATAIPCFLGYTEMAREQTPDDLLMKGKKIRSIAEFQQYYGGAPPLENISVTLDATNSPSNVSLTNNYYLYDSLRMFFNNGGGQCYIISIGKYPDSPSIGTTSPKVGIKGGLEVLRKIDEPTMIVCPDATLTGTELYTFAQDALRQAGDLMDRVAILDTADSGDLDQDVNDFRNAIGINNLKYGAAYTPWLKARFPKNIRYRNISLQRSSGSAVLLENLTPTQEIKDLIAELNSAVAATDDIIDGIIDDNNGAGDYPQKTLQDEFDERLDTHDAAQPGFANIGDYRTSLRTLYDLIIDIGRDIQEFEASLTDSANWKMQTDTASIISNYGLEDEMQRLFHNSVAFDGTAIVTGTKFTNDVQPFWAATNSGDGGAIDLAYTNAADDAARGQLARNAAIEIFGTFNGAVNEILSTSESYETALSDGLKESFGTYKSILTKIDEALNVLPPSGAIAGIYAFVDNKRGVHKAPANVSLNGVQGLTQQIDFALQEDLNVDVNAGKSVNAIREFAGKGILVWGARTLAGNDNEWRYVPVRRFFNMVEESVKKSTYWAVFEPNDANLWVRIKAMIENYLIEKWKEGALAGATPEDAFFVKCGLGLTMTPQDILEGRLNVEIGMAVVRPAEFIILKFSHKMQES